MQAQARDALRRAWLEQELARYKDRSRTQPENIDAWRRLGRIYGELGDAEAALAAIEQVLALQPDDQDALWGRITMCLGLNRNQDALATADQFLALMPEHVDVSLQRVEALRRLGRVTEALESGEQLLTIPRLGATQRAAILSARGALLIVANRIKEALTTVEEALALSPNHPVLTLHRAVCWLQMRRYAEALESVEALVAIPSARFGALCVQARALAVLRRFDEADVILSNLQEQYQHRSLEVTFEPWRLPGETLADSLPKRYTARGLYLMDFFEQLACCDWSNRAAVLSEIETLVADALHYGFVAGMEPFNLLTLPIEPALQQAVANAQAVAVAARMKPIRENLQIAWPEASTDGRLCIGYVSGDFRDHPTAHLAHKLFRLHDRSRFRIIGFSLRPGDNSTYWHNIVEGCDEFIELVGLSHAEAAVRIAREKVHILVDMHGYTRFARPEVFALRPAPVQVGFLGYPGTLGADYIPYIIADPVVLPEAMRAWFSEQPVYLPCYQVNDDEQTIANTGMTRKDRGLPEDAFVFCCFNNTGKLEPESFASWMRIMAQVPGSVLWLLASNTDAIQNLRQAAISHGIDPSRLIFAGRLPKAEHLERYRLADLFLDSFVYGAHTTASDALWAGLPMITLRGARFQSRVCASLLSALGLTELIAERIVEFEVLAVSLARQPDRLEAIRQQLQARCLAGLPFRTAEFARCLERTFFSMWRAYKDRRVPQAIHV
ncbi:MAG: hypothetical protein CSA09_05170 [Candidatus Contendobacter odensis]|uniref:protein O-GlcNAc transferase n=1 Tax=Candidatus Contendibacter odensensis TaxID=1400860 RepID=A0A2G6PE15_9GAMM|nr:MAG: hypothetical protein CSA09_05170 [Candidatus Contendobacter odensis]